MTIPLSDRVAAGILIWLTDEQRALFPLGTVVTKDDHGILTASVPVTKPDARDRIAHVRGTNHRVSDLAAHVREHFPPPLSPESPP